MSRLSENITPALRVDHLRIDLHGRRVRLDASKDVKIRNAELHELWQQADALPDEEQRALIMVIDSFVTKVNVEKAVKKSVRQR